MKGEARGKVRDLNDADTIADLQAKLGAAQAEAARASMQRDYVLRLLRQQQTLSIASMRDEKLVLFMEKNGIFARALTFVPQKLKDMIPLRAKQFLKDIIVRIG